MLFKDIDDYYRGIFSIYEFNTTTHITIRERRKERQKLKKAIRDPLSDSFDTDNRNPLVEVLLFCFMPNHIHLLLRQLKNGGITKYMNKIGAGYPAYFKRKYDLKNKGYFFQGRFVSVRIKTDEQLKIVFVYIHTNPISLIEPNWKKVGIKDPEKAIRFLENKYRWSSYFDYIGKKNFPSVTEREFILEIIDGRRGCKDFIKNWVRYKGEIGKFANIALE